MVKIIFDVLDAWVHENNYVYGIVDEGITRADTVDRMNKALKEWDYPGRIASHDQCRQMWVEPEILLREQWNPDFISSEPITGWVHVLYANAEEL